VLLAALRRFALLLAWAMALAGLLGLAIAALTHRGALRGLAIGFYLGGVVLCALAFLLGSRAPVRGKSGGGFVGLGRWIGGGVRFATREEQDEALNLPALLASIGVCLIVVGAAVDSAHSFA
jgi:hypothetical protein